MSRLLTVCIVLFMAASFLRADTADEARAALAKSVAAMRKLAIHGGYAGIYDLKTGQNYGESLKQKAKPGMIWVQPPGTQIVGEAYLRAYEATGEKGFLEAAVEVARALWWTQRKAGGWEHLNDISGFDISRPAPRPEGRCTFDDNNTQSAIVFLIHLDPHVDEAWFQEMLELSLQHLLISQYPNGGWPQWYPLIGGYHDYYTFNDGGIRDIIGVLLLAHQTYGRAEFLEAAKRGGDFIMATQGEEPQPIWAQQYDKDLKPAKARAFEPAGYSSGESVTAMRALMDLAAYTGDAKYLQPIPAALAWFKRSEIAPGKWSRLYEIGTNRPIYGDRDGSVHYKVEELSEERRTGYGWHGDFGFPSFLRQYEKLQEQGLAKAQAARLAKKPAEKPADAKKLRQLEAAAKQAMAQMDAEGRWVDGKGNVTTRDFVVNAKALTDYLAAKR